MSERTCMVCARPLTKKPGVGRWPKYCSEHRPAYYPNKNPRPHPPRPARPCAYCGAEFTPARRRTAQFCSDLCRTRARTGALARYTRTATCAICTEEFKAFDSKQVTCSKKCRYRHNHLGADPVKVREQRARANRVRRARKKGAGSIERFTLAEIFERDKWRCGICGKRVNKRLKWPHPMSVSLDHIVPFAQGGAHVRSNVRCAHYLCNSVRGERGGGEQLRLLG